MRLERRARPRVDSRHLLLLKGFLIWMVVGVAVLGQGCLPQPRLLLEGAVARHRKEQRRGVAVGPGGAGEGGPPIGRAAMHRNRPLESADDDDVGGPGRGLVLDAATAGPFDSDGDERHVQKPGSGCP